MPRFDWTARDKAGRNLSGTLEAPSKDTVRSQLQSQGFIVTNVDASASAQRGTVDFAARLEAHSAGTVDYTARLKPSTPKPRPFVALAVSAVLGAVGVAVLRVSGWPPPVAPAIVAAVFLLLSVAVLATSIVGLLMPARMAAAVDGLKRQAEQSRRRR
jgi:hypothetical protein